MIFILFLNNWRSLSELINLHKRLAYENISSSSSSSSSKRIKKILQYLYKIILQNIFKILIDRTRHHQRRKKKEKKKKKGW